MIGSTAEIKNPRDLFDRYPSMDDDIVAEVVGASHFNLDRVKELVTQRPELARATWDWGFGDWETAIGAASHVGRRDIAEFLMQHGARPDIFTFAMFGNYEAVKAMIQSKPGVQTIYGPQGISLLSHAEVSLRSESLSKGQMANCKKLINYLEDLQNTNPQQKQIEMNPEEKEKYVGDYMYGENDIDGFSVKINRRNYLSLGKLGKFGSSLFQQANGVFEYSGISSVKIMFEEMEEKVTAVIVQQPDLSIKANKV